MPAAKASQKPTTKSQRPVGIMRQDLYQELYDLEKDYWWHVGKRSLVEKLIQKYLRPGKNRQLVDVGCGSGLMMEILKKYGEPHGVDLTEEALKFCRQRGLKNLYQADVTKLPFKKDQVDLVIALDLIEHVADDVAAFREFHRVVKPGGIIVISVPAFKFLWSYWDDILGHERRYTARSLATAITKAGFKVEKVGYSNSLILLPTFLMRKLKSLKKIDPEEQPSDFIPTPRALNKLLTSYYALETSAAANIRLPAGLSVIAVARKT